MSNEIEIVEEFQVSKDFGGNAGVDSEGNTYARFANLRFPNCVPHFALFQVESVQGMVVDLTRYHGQQC